MDDKIVKPEKQSVILRSDVLKQLDAMKAAQFAKLPENYKESAFFAIEKLSSLEGIEKVTAVDITKNLIKMFKYKLDYLKNHCYFFVQNDKNSETGKSLRFGWQYQGLIHVSKLECGVINVHPVLVLESDIFETHYQDGVLIIDKHIPSFEGAIKGGYCVIEFTSNQRIIKYYTKAELDKRKSKSMAQNGQFWWWEREMYEKTLINASLKKIIETNGEEINEEDLEDKEDAKRISITETVPQNEINLIAPTRLKLENV